MGAVHQGRFGVRVSIDLAALTRTHWYEYALRFLLGGLVTAMAALIAEHFGAAVGGLFLAFPAIFPASATLVEKHEAMKKARAGIAHTARGRQAAGLDAAGATLGSIALMGFGWLVWVALGKIAPAAALTAAAIGWLILAAALWWLRKSHLFSISPRSP
jgi:Protein of unknown function (DUF3147)